MEYDPCDADRLGDMSGQLAIFLPVRNVPDVILPNYEQECGT